eukprot:TRINITY_DN1575_c0_g1_i7.p1 TRINITY_DN1575_c0_g1~~TRINITY_DN1575_c0_g1_i7.p1  ORF type:complete len:111 (+),score=13.69 TRINITY_DN1575_c0_g1_i7:200-532(+)
MSSMQIHNGACEMYAPFLEMVLKYSMSTVESEKQTNMDSACQFVILCLKLSHGECCSADLLFKVLVGLLSSVISNKTTRLRNVMKNVLLLWRMSQESRKMFAVARDLQKL